MRLSILCLAVLAAAAQDLREVEIPASAGGPAQKAMWFDPGGSGPVPLLVALHSWSGDYKQKDANDYASRCAARGWAMVFPDFRGPNLRPEAGGSDAAVSDVMDALAWAKKQVRVDDSRVYLAGGSGGGYMSLLMAARHPKAWTAVSAWVPISDLAAWHGDSVKAKRKYADDLEKVFGGPPGMSRLEEYRRRSPLFWLGRIPGVSIEISAGIHDGHAGSVPVRHSLQAFNELARANEKFGQAIPEAAIVFMTDKEKVPEELGPPPSDASYPKAVLFRREAGPTRVTLFEGGHEVLYDPMFAWLEKRSR